MNTCPICFKDELQDNEKAITNCNHIFCNNCIKKWIDRKRLDCPTCRQIITNYKNNKINNRIIVLQNNQEIQRNMLLENNYIKLYKSYKLCKFMFSITSLTLLLYTYLYNVTKTEYDILENKYIECLYNNSLYNSNLIKVTIFNNYNSEICYVPYYFIQNC